jgi:hypothetical protein
VPPIDLSDPFFKITLPLLVGIFIAIWNQSRHFDRAIEQISKRIDDLAADTRAIRTELKDIRTELADLNRRLPAAAG